ncbi:MAG: cation:proton antiporter [Chromatiales bacterium]|jgi:glutathione-regulated potassium-efflux system protein KefB
MEPESFVLSATLLLAVSAIAVAVFKHIGLGSVLGLLVAGIVVGPHTPGPYITTEVEAVRQFTELGVVLLLFLIGLEIKPSRLWAMRRHVFGLGSLQILVSGLAISAYVGLYVGPWPTALLMGLTLALSSTAFVMQILQERGEFASPHGNACFAVLLMQDLAIVPLLALVPILSDKGTLSAEVPLWEQVLIVLGLLGLVWLFGRYVLPPSLDRLTQQRNREGFLLVIMLAVFLAAWAMHEAGLSMALGAFLMGMMLCGSRYNYQIQAAVEPYKGLLMSLFFVAVGMSIDIGALSERPLTFAQHVLAIVAIKLVVLFALALAFRLGRPVAIRLAFYLAQSGEFGFVLFGSAKVLGVIDDATFALAVGVISVSMLITPLLVRGGDRLARRFRDRAHAVTPYGYDLGGAESSARVVIGGYGRVGHTVATLLEASGVPYIAFDTDPARVAEGKTDRRPVYYGDVADPELLASAGAGQADLVVLTVDHGPTALRTVSHLRNHFPRLPIIARARDLVACDHLITAGATQAYPEAVEASLRLGAEALQMIGVAADNVNQLMFGVRSSNYALVRDEEGQTGPARQTGAAREGQGSAQGSG